MPTILLKKSDTPGSVPGTANLTNLAGGVEVAVNTADKRVYSMTSASAVIELGTNPSSLTCSDGSFVLLKAASASITNLTATSIVISNLSIASANITTLTSASATITNLINTSASITTLTNNPTFSAGTANGVLYLNGSKVATSGSALSFTGSLLKVGNPTNAPNTNLSGNLLQVKSASGFSYLTMGNGDGADNNTYIGSASSITTFGTVTDAGATSELMRLTSTGLGIGTTSPVARLDVFKTSSDTISRANAVGAFGDYVSLGAGLLLQQTLSSPYGFALQAANAANSVQFPLLLNPSGGNLGIGTSSPGYKLSVSGVATTYAGAASIALYDTVGSGITDSRNWLIGNVAAGNYGELNFAVSSAAGGAPTNSKMTLDRSGSLGLGVTPSAWVNATASQVGFAAALSSRSAGNTASDMTHGAYWNGSNWLYQSTSVGAARYQMTGANAGSTHAWFTSIGGTAGNAISFTQAMTLDASGNLGLGTTTPSIKIDVQSGSGSIGFFRNNSSTATTSYITVINANNTTNGLVMAHINDGTGYFGTQTNSALRFVTNDAERGRFSAGGYFKASNAGTYVDSAGSYHELRANGAAGDWTAIVSNSTATSANAYGVSIRYTGAAPNGTGNEFLHCYDNASGGTTRATIRSNGGLANYQANDVNLSDERTKKDIAPLGSMWAKFKAIEIVTFKYKDQTHDDDNIGVIAQQVESVAPEFIDTDGFGETPEDGVPLKTVYTTDMYHAAIKALQEAMARIESLEADVAALKGAK